MTEKDQIVKSIGDTFFLEKRGIPKGCEYCLEGAKVVLFINGICQRPQHCNWYCPISEKRRGKTDTYADEIKITEKRELLEEINKIDAKGMSITGGEPLTKDNLGKTIEYIKFVKENMGSDFHIHLYTNGINFNEEIAFNLSKAGLDEIRFHPPKERWNIIKTAIDKGMKVGVELPVIPQDNYIQLLKEFIIYLDKIRVDFINLNEFEICFPNSKMLKKRGFTLKENSVASVRGSKEKAIEILKEFKDKVSIKIHFCPIIAKDYYQLKNRYLRRANNIKRPFEEITDEGLLLFARVFGKVQNIIKFYRCLLEVAHLPKRLCMLKDKQIFLPVYVALENEFIRNLDKLDLGCEIVEKTPFKRETYFQITETTPLEVFKNEYEWS